MEKQYGSVMVSWDFSQGVESGVLIVGKQERGKNTEIINAFMGKEAEDLIKKLTTHSKGGSE